ncbi:hypothetical protein [Xanthomonas rydalmerensis]|uniref:Uncharacterized protein n=1 Tax=Xanthomonas rydalmerensis TaxID=3046274 RepID=A0ABZ0JJD2_9XANT|nr:hypothetical protein [Xanthomonas sp. DM-2023]WOS39908.1 hypothetical protein QN243_16015 [Xanthomonas sp. DM-2023]WOS44092.1 hypothetical protein QN242_16015 [Xanthomonas sp. DM-2023]WOS48272.1 hypothetical protein QN240_16015 [Xanthomonas sp. DM-2023]WOS52451.1 hypothetical protein QN244_16015 [Xanthomonas sp. DM-2023]WOS56635.1 hypothetical protein QN245_16015 [Xanthomonas sp. DM-2023]
MAKIQIEEREYETALYQELGSTNGHLWAPGQVLEAFMAFDYSTYTKNPKFWNAVGKNPQLGVNLNPKAPSFKKIKRPLPQFALNLFVQAKRPRSHRMKAEAKLAAHKLGSPCWRFKISQPQHRRLRKLAKAAGNKAYVCYAAPVFHMALKLYTAQLKGTIIDQSTFPPVLALGKHHAWNYSQPGAKGVANSEPEPIEETGLRDRISAMLRDDQQHQEMSPGKALKRLWNAADASSKEEIESMGARRREKYLARRKAINALRTRGQEEARAMIYCLHLINYANTFDMIWLVISPVAKQAKVKS